MPEPCKVAGITDDLKRKNAREVNQCLFANAAEKFKRCKGFFEALMESEKCILEIKRWGVELEDRPLPVQAYKLPAGTLLAGRNEIDLEKHPDFDREIRGMYREVPLEKWGVIYSKRSGKEASALMNELGKCIKDWGYPCQRPKELVINTDSLNDFMG